MDDAVDYRGRGLCHRHCISKLIKADAVLRLYPAWLRKLPAAAVYFVRGHNGLTSARHHGTVTALGNGAEVWFVSEALGRIKVLTESVSPLGE